jgi:hypothetical protein
MSPVTIERPAVAAPSRLGLVSRLRNRVSAVLAMLAALVVVPAGAASATTPDSDLTGGAGDTFFTAITSYFQDNVIVAVLGLFALTVGVAVLMKWGRKAAKS